MRSCLFSRPRSLARALPLVLLLAVANGCRPAGPDAGTDAGSDAGASPDSGGGDTDAGLDSGTGTDAGPTWSASPVGLLATDDTLYVAAMALDATFTPGPGFVAAIDRAAGTEVGRVTTSAPQPQFLALDTAGTGLVVASSGIVDFSMFPTIFIATTGAVDVYALGSLAPTASVALTPDTAPMPLGGGLGPIGVADTSAGPVAFGGSSLTGDLYAIDLANEVELHGPADPIAYFPASAGFTGVHALAGGLVVTDFATDEVCIGGDPDMDLAGATCVNLRVEPGTPVGVTRVCGFAGPELYAITFSGELVELAPEAGGGYTLARHDLGGFVDPQGLACAADGNVYVSLSYGQDRIARFEPASAALNTTWLMLPAGATPRDVVVVGPPPVTGYVANSGNDTVTVFDPATAAVTATIPIAAP